MKDPSGESSLVACQRSQEPNKVSSCSSSLLPGLLQWLSLGKSPGLREENRRMYLLFPCSASHLIQLFKKSLMKRNGIINFQVCRKMKDDLLISGIAICAGNAFGNV